LVACFGVSKDYDQFVKNLKQIEKQLIVANNDPEPIVQNIEKSREKLIAELLPVIKVISVYAYDKGMKKLEKKSLMDRNNLEKMKQGELENVALGVWKAIDKLLNDPKKKSEDIINYGLSEKMISSLHDSVLTFSNLRVNLKEEKKAKKNANEEILNLTKENNKILKYRIDNYIYLFEQSNPEFFECYFIARKSKPQKETFQMWKKRKKKSSN
jgi:DNA-binding Xre family transcriptional regulator